MVASCFLGFGVARQQKAIDCLSCGGGGSGRASDILNANACRRRFGVPLLLDAVIPKGAPCASQPGRRQIEEPPTTASPSRLASMPHRDGGVVAECSISERRHVSPDSMDKLSATFVDMSHKSAFSQPCCLMAAFWFGFWLRLVA